MGGSSRKTVGIGEVAQRRHLGWVELSSPVFRFGKPGKPLDQGTDLIGMMGTHGDDNSDSKYILQ